MSDYQYPSSTGRSNILGTEAFRNLLGQSLYNAKEEIIILSAFVKIKGVNWLVDNIQKKTLVVRLYLMGSKRYSSGRI